MYSSTSNRNLTHDWKIKFSQNKHKKYTKLDTSVMKLRYKYNNLKHEWWTITDHIKSGSGIAPKNEPTWYRIINEVFQRRMKKFLQAHKILIYNSMVNSIVMMHTILKIRKKVWIMMMKMTLLIPLEHKRTQVQ